MCTDGSSLEQRLIFPEKSGIDPFWYSARAAVAGTLFLFLLVQALSCLIPPFQSPDEPAHIERAYRLAKGTIFLDTRAGYTGGDIDTGLVTYMSQFAEIPFQYNHKMTASIARAGEHISWSDKAQFRGFSNTATYFPLPYVPAALALFVGERVGLSVRDTYYLSRTLSLTAALGLLLAALLIYPIPLAVIALFLLPMTLFQLGSATLDSVTYGTSALTAALFMRGLTPSFSFSSRMLVALTLCSISLATSRIALIPLTFLPAAIYRVRSSYRHLISSVVSLGLSLAWIIFALITVKGLSTGGFSAIEVSKYYLLNPASFVQVCFNTFINGRILISYLDDFIGVLGWLDTPLSSQVYWTCSLLLLTLSFISIPRDRHSLINYGSIVLFGVAVLSLLFIFIIELAVYTPHPAKVIVGFQGRYFTPILIFIGYSIFRRPPSSTELKLAALVAFPAITFSLVDMTLKLLYRYWQS